MQRLRHSKEYSRCARLLQRSNPLRALIAALFALGLLSGSARAEAPPESPDPLFAFDSPIGLIDYTLGRGLRFESLGLNIGGFTAIEFEQEEHDLLEIEGINFLVLWEPLDWFSAFMELEVGPLLVHDFDTGKNTHDTQAEFERLYADLIAGDPFRLRFGKFQTPVGRWNLVPAEPFTWTASEPVFLEVGFSEHQTGAAFQGSLYPGEGILNYWIYSQFLDPLEISKDSDPDDEGEDDIAENTIGGRLEYTDPLARWSVGASFLASELRDDWSYLGGLDGELLFGPLELTSEFTIVRGDIPETDFWDIYVQGVLGVGHGFYLVARYEHWDPMGKLEDVDLGDLGIAYVPFPWLRLKVDYRIPSRETEDVFQGVTASLSLVF